MIRIATVVLSVVPLASATGALADGHYFVDLFTALAGYEVANPCGLNSSGAVTGGCTSPPPPLLTCSSIPAAPRVA